jgi:hypothetical protein
MEAIVSTLHDLTLASQTKDGGTFDTFHPFERLPTELRLKIWKNALPGPRIVEIDVGRKGMKRGSPLTVESLPLLQVNFESRELCSKAYQIIEPSNHPIGIFFSAPGPLYFNPEMDLLLITTLGCRIDKLGEALGPILPLKTFRSIALPFYRCVSCSIPTDGFLDTQLLAVFPGLEKVYGIVKDPADHPFDAGYGTVKFDGITQITRTKSHPFKFVEDITNARTMKTMKKSPQLRLPVFIMMDVVRKK